MILKPARIPAVAPETAAFAARFTGSAGSIKAETIQAIDRFVRDCIQTGVWSKLTEVYPFVGDSLNGAMIKLKRTSAITPDLTAVNFVEADYAERGANGGLLGNGSTKYVDTNVLTNALPAAAQLAVYLREDVSTVSYLMGGSDGSPQIAGIASPAGTNSSGVLGANNSTTVATQLVKGFYLIERATPPAWRSTKTMSPSPPALLTPFRRIPP